MGDDRGGHGGVRPGTQAGRVLAREVHGLRLRRRPDAPATEVLDMATAYDLVCHDLIVHHTPGPALVDQHLHPEACPSASLVPARVSRRSVPVDLWRTPIPG